MSDPTQSTTPPTADPSGSLLLTAAQLAQGPWHDENLRVRALEIMCSTGLRTLELGHAVSESEAKMRSRLMEYEALREVERGRAHASNELRAEQAQRDKKRRALLISVVPVLVQVMAGLLDKEKEGVTDDEEDEDDEDPPATTGGSPASPPTDAAEAPAPVSR